MYIDDLKFNMDLAKKYHCNAQKMRVLSENWVEHYSYCPCCGNPIFHYENNKPVADFYCKKCDEDFELKCKKKSLGNKIVDGCHQTMLDRLKSNRTPNFFFMIYQDYCVKDLLFVPKHFFVEDIIEKRKPLAQTARRAGWVGCNILLKNIPDSGKIYYIKDQLITKPEDVLNQYNKTIFLANQKLHLRGWTLDIMRCIEKIPSKEFNLEDIYKFENILQAKHPQNKFIKDKIRQQLQYLRDKGYLIFNGRGSYKRL